MSDVVNIPKQPRLAVCEDYTELRRQGIEYLKQLGSALWTDYNIHDPGITLLELLCYAETEIGYKAGFRVQDLIAPYPGRLSSTELQALYEAQGFYTARNILTVNPWTARDYRKLLIDVLGVRNAWLRCKDCACGITLYADCKSSTLGYKKTEHPVRIRGFYDVRIELDEHPADGDIGSGKVLTVFPVPASGGAHRATLEMRFPQPHVAAERIPQLHALLQEDCILQSITVDAISGRRGQPVDVPAQQLYPALHRPLFVTMRLTFRENPAAAEATITLSDLPIRVWYREDADRKAITLAMLREVLADVSAGGGMARYLRMLRRAAATTADVEAVLHAHRNLAEDFCTIGTVPMEDIAVCADIGMRADADIERVLGEAYWRISQYFNPSVQFRSLFEMLDEGFVSESIFNGPALDHGFIRDADLDASEMKTVLYASDVINILMDIDGIERVSNLTLARYDENGKLVESQPWELQVTEGSLPRLYIHGSKVLVFKNELPFLPDPDELHDALQLHRGLEAKNKSVQTRNDFPVPSGSYVDNTSSYPLQYSLPDTYGLSPHGLPESVGTARKGQAKQLAGYLLVFEQLLSVYLGQLRHFRDLLSIDASISQSYFPGMLTETQLRGVSALYDAVTEPELLALLETPASWTARRNLMLDHMLARFAESFSDYALMLYSASASRQLAAEELIEDKISFLKALPVMTRDRGKAFNYRDPSAVCSPLNISGLEQRIRTLLGMNGLAGAFTPVIGYDAVSGSWTGLWEISNGATVLLRGVEQRAASRTETARLLAAHIETAADALQEAAGLKLHAKRGHNTVELHAGDDTVLGAHPQEFSKKADAETLIADIQAFLAGMEIAETIHVVEHILLRPKNAPSADFPAGDPVLPVCLPSDCSACGEEDPYSFRLTVVLNGEEGLANHGIEFRRFAERSIRQEVPAHLGVKICWVSSAQLTEFSARYCAWLSALAEEAPDAALLHERLERVLEEFVRLKSVYPRATLHDCVDGDDENRIYLNRTII
ncbi:MAG: hypothetical protein M5R41_19040 [Bacteroidia bacterium]|nr:hypothetical protein [Bacteroidia bacterium]